jgi:pyrimidine operon attenuation protein/uracil phosphoribosyltransferase
VSTLILDSQQISHKVRRIAFEIYENNYEEDELILAGIDDKGYQLAQLLMAELISIANFKVTLVKVVLDKEHPMGKKVQIDIAEKDVKDKCVILIDDVLNTGRTLAYGMHPFMEIKIKKMEIAVLVNRSHKLFPVSASYSGYELSTTLSDRIEVVFANDKSAVYLQ